MQGAQRREGSNHAQQLALGPFKCKNREARQVCQMCKTLQTTLPRLWLPS
jgi:hypothetical protein